MEKKITVGSCFSGIGGLELGLEWTGGFETRWQIENDEYATKVLEKHWPNVTRYKDIRDVVRPPAVDLICGGFPCQDVSLAGKRAGLRGVRTTLWGEMFRLVCEVRPRWVVAENVPGLLSSDDGRFFGNILRDLASIGFDAEWGVLSAAGVGAPHLRRRIFIVANASGTRGWGGEEPRVKGKETSPGSEKVANTQGDGMERLKAELEKPSEGEEVRRIKRSRENVGNSSSQRFQNRTESEMAQARKKSLLKRSDWWAIEPDVGRVAHGVTARVDKLKCLGNAVVPQVAQKIGEMILRENHL